MIHQVYLGENTNGSTADRVDMTGKLQGLGIDNVNISGGDGQDNAVGFGDILRNQVAGLLLNIGGLITNRDLQE